MSSKNNIQKSKPNGSLSYEAIELIMRVLSERRFRGMSLQQREDAFQNCAVAALEAMRDHDGCRETPSSYLMTILRRRAIRSLGSISIKASGQARKRPVSSVSVLRRGKAEGADPKSPQHAVTIHLRDAITYNADRRDRIEIQIKKPKRRDMRLRDLDAAMTNDDKYAEPIDDERLPACTLRDDEVDLGEIGEWVDTCRGTERKLLVWLTQNGRLPARKKDLKEAAKALNEKHSNIRKVWSRFKLSVKNLLNL